MQQPLDDYRMLSPIIKHVCEELRPSHIVAIVESASLIGADSSALTAALASVLQQDRPSTIEYLFSRDDELMRLVHHAGASVQREDRLISLLAGSIMLLRFADAGIESFELPRIILYLIEDSKVLGEGAKAALLQYLCALHRKRSDEGAMDSPVLATGLAILSLHIACDRLGDAIHHMQRADEQEPPLGENETRNLSWYGYEGIDVASWRKACMGVLLADEGLYARIIELIRRVG